VLRRKFWDRFRELQAAGRTLFITTQYVGEATYCDLIGVMANGKLLQVDTPTGLRHRAFGGDVVQIRTARRLEYAELIQLQELPFVRGNVRRVGEQEIQLVVDDAGTALASLGDWARERNVEVESLQEYQPPFDDVFVELVREEETSGS
jgi:ABC-2 type transport system ATP-binding protein